MSTDNAPEAAAGFLEGPLFKEATPPTAGLEVYDAEWRAGAQALGYREAAETLINVIIEGNRPTSGTLLHPLLFLYRHGLELRLKGLIDRYGTEPPPNKHGLLGLWQYCQEIITPYSSDEAIGKASKLIEELHSVDPLGQSFRYATTSNGTPIKFPVAAVDLAQLQTQMDDLDTFFYGFEDMIDETRRANCE